MKHLEVRQKCSATRRIFNSFLSVSSQWWWNTASHAWYISYFLLFVAFDIRNAWKTVFFDTELWFCYLPVVSLLTLSSIANQDSLLAIILKVSTRHPWHSPFIQSRENQLLKHAQSVPPPGDHLVGPSPSALLSVICPSLHLWPADNTLAKKKIIIVSYFRPTDTDECKSNPCLNGRDVCRWSL